MPFNKTVAIHAYTVEVRITDSGLCLKKTAGNEGMQS
jgi:hypothetical protein